MTNIWSIIRHSSRHKLKIRPIIKKYLSTSNAVWQREENVHKGESGQFDLSRFPLDRIRNFSIIAHIDHGKSTLADRILEITGAIPKNDENAQVLDTLQVERDRGITVKAQSASVVFKYKNEDYLLNLIDTPGHVDFSYEVSRALSACQGVILLVDANQGIQAQTVANFYLAFVNELVIVPVLNKVDLKNAQPDVVKEQLMNAFDINPDEVQHVSAKFGTGVEELLKSVVEKIPPPSKICGKISQPRALLFDSWFEKYKGVNCQILVVDGQFKKGDLIQSFHTKKCYEIKELVFRSPLDVHVNEIFAGQVGVVRANIREPKEAQVGDTFHIKGDQVDALPGFKEPKCMVFAGIFPIESRDQLPLKSALDRLRLNDSSVSVEPESSVALGQGWRVGFLGLLHMDVFNTRLEQEHNVPVIVTTPSVPYKIKKIEQSGKVLPISKKSKRKESAPEETIVNNPAQWPEMQREYQTYEPFVRGTIIMPEHYLNEVNQLCEERRGEQLDLQQLGNSRVLLTYRLPLNEIVIDFYDDLKSITSGYATFDYEDEAYRESSLEKVGIKLNGVLVEELSYITHESKAITKARKMCLRLADILPRQQFQVAIQAVIGSKIVARENVKALRKDVLAKCYGGDVTRKMKLLRHQAEGKKRMKTIGKIDIPRETFLEILKK